jgi:hypothetical protein
MADDALHALAKALGVTIADLLGERLTASAEPGIDPALRELAEQDGLSQADVAMLASIEWRGEPPRTVRRWRHIYDAIVSSRSLDDQ